MALGNNYLKFNDVYIPNPESMSVDYENIENVAQSEAGTNLAIVTRLQKRTFNCTFNCTSAWLTNFKSMCGLSSGTLLWLGESIEAMARITNAALQPYSEHADRTNGLWVITVTFTEV